MVIDEFQSSRRETVRSSTPMLFALSSLFALWTGLLSGVLLAGDSVLAWVIWVVLALAAFWTLYRLVRRSCRPVTGGLLLRGFWRSYNVPWARVSSIQHSNYHFGYAEFTSALVYVVFVDEPGVTHGVAVSANKQNRSSADKARTINSWAPVHLQGMIGIHEIHVGPPPGCEGELLKVLRASRKGWGPVK